MAALEDEGTQRRGLVEIVWHLSPCSGRHNTHLRLFRAMSTLLSSLPWRCAAVHYCYDQQLPRAPMALFRPNSGTINCQHRFRAHKGKPAFLEYSFPPLRTSYQLLDSSSCHFRIRLNRGMSSKSSRVRDTSCFALIGE